MGIDVTAFGLPILMTSLQRKREKEGEWGKKIYRVFSDVNRIGKPKAVISIPILLGHYRHLRKFRFDRNVIVIKAFK